MKRIFIICILTIIPTAAFADWTLIQTSDDGNLYVDFDTLQKTGDTVTISTLNDFYNRQDKNELSTKWREMHDCKKKRFKALSVDYYTEKMGQGSIMDSATFDEAKTAWSDLVQYSVGELKTNIICSK